jgi:hypothetical protein
MRLLFRSAILVSVIALSARAADAPYVGKWKLNIAKSDFGEQTLIYEQTAAGEMKVTTSGQSWTFKTDGKDYPTPWGTMISYKTVNPTTWESSEKVNGKVTSTATMKLSSDGKSLIVDAKNVKAGGEVSNDSVVYDRVSGTSGLAGKWKTKNLKVGIAGTMTLAANGADGVMLTYVEEKGSCSAKFDGKDAPATGPIWPSGWTCSIAKNGASGLDISWKKDGKLMGKDAFTVSADGNTLTDLGTVPGNTEKTRAVYDKQ